ncbi:MAG TPA: hypothetical protein DDW53_01160 [Lachnoclostridium sp.]|uniref:integrase DNA-binding domain-containing protein n=1 Tax=Lacrimispora celerecrescens TaxID=29354 RepID=UPI000E99BDAE|nr:hypothetical protein [Lachnoclostridium sp.]
MKRRVLKEGESFRSDERYQYRFNLGDGKCTLYMLIHYRSCARKKGQYKERGIMGCMKRQLILSI